MEGQPFSHYCSSASTLLWYVGMCLQRCIHTYITMWLSIIFILLPSNTLKVAYGVQSTTSSMQHFFYHPLVNIANSTITQSYACTIYGFPISLCMHLCIIITVSWWFSLHILPWWLCCFSLASERIYISCPDVLYQI